MGKPNKERKKVTKPFSKKSGALKNLKLRWVNNNNKEKQPKSEEMVFENPDDSKTQFQHLDFFPQVKTEVAWIESDQATFNDSGTQISHQNSPLGTEQVKKEVTGNENSDGELLFERPWSPPSSVSSVDFTRKRSELNEIFIPETHTQISTKSNDQYDIAGINVANKLRRMDNDQRIYAEYLIDSILYCGLQKKLDQTKINSFQEHFQAKR